MRVKTPRIIIHPKILTNSIGAAAAGRKRQLLHGVMNNITRGSELDLHLFLTSILTSLVNVLNDSSATHFIKT